VVNEWRRLADAIRRSRALVFCVSVAHAQFMTTGSTGRPAGRLRGGRHAPRNAAGRPQRLLRGEVAALVTVDLYNEGIDLPMVDTLLLLRPRRARCCSSSRSAAACAWHRARRAAWCSTFVGQHRTEFRFDRLLSSLTGCRAVS
jgi:hypothetical protein